MIPKGIQTLGLQQSLTITIIGQQPSSSHSPLINEVLLEFHTQGSTLALLLFYGNMKYQFFLSLNGIHFGSQGIIQFVGFSVTTVSIKQALAPLNTLIVY